jgi:hypothetical protein
MIIISLVDEGMSDKKIHENIVEYVKYLLTEYYSYFVKQEH